MGGGEMDPKQGVTQMKRVLLFLLVLGGAAVNWSYAQKPATPARRAGGRQDVD